jgi:hypothetical protein
MNSGQINFGPATSGQRTFSINDIPSAQKDTRAAPKTKWLLLAPDGRIWVEEDPMRLARQLALTAMEIEGFKSLEVDYGIL